MKNVKLKIAYDGSHFFGWQNNGRERSVERELNKALFLFLQHPIELQAASRTDRGVHANGQIVNFFTDHDLTGLQSSLNALLPEDLRILEVEEMPNHFHPTVDVRAKEYRYILSTSKVQCPFRRAYAWHVPDLLCMESMKRATSQLMGSHDFLGFSNRHEKTDTVRELFAIDFLEEQDEMHILIKGDHFLYKMARNIVGTLVYIGQGKLNVDVIEALLSSKDRKLGGITAPAYGLYLEKILY